MDQQRIAIAGQTETAAAEVIAERGSIQHKVIRGKVLHAAGTGRNRPGVIGELVKIWHGARRVAASQ